MNCPLNFFTLNRDFLAREKTSQAFREILHSQYKSSTVSRRKERQTKRVLRGAEENNHSCDNSTSEYQDDRRHSTPGVYGVPSHFVAKLCYYLGLANGLAEAISAARRELGDIDDDDDEEYGHVKKKAKSIPRRSSDPMIFHMKLSSSLYDDCSTTAADRAELTVTATLPKPGHKKRIPNNEPWSPEPSWNDRPLKKLAASNTELAANNSFSKSASTPSLPDIPISALLKDGKPINVNQDVLRQACEMYAVHTLPESAVGYWGHYNARS